MTDPNAEADKLFHLADAARDRGDFLLAAMYAELAAYVRVGGPDVVASVVTRAIEMARGRQ